MKFIVSKASDYHPEERPCIQAKREKILEQFRSYGRNAPEDAFDVERNAGGYILSYKRYVDEWIIEIDTMEQLFELMSEVDYNTVIKRKHETSEMPEIIIYDDYIE